MDTLWWIAGIVLCTAIFVTFWSRLGPQRRRNAHNDEDEEEKAIRKAEERRKLHDKIEGADSVLLKEPIDENIQRKSTEFLENAGHKLFEHLILFGQSSIRRFVGNNSSSSSSSSNHSPRGISPYRHNYEVNSAEDDAIHGVRRQSRRHSYTTTSYATKVAKNWLVGQNKHKELIKQGRPPRPPNEFFEPDRITIEVPTHLSPSMFYVLHHLKTLELPETWILNPTDIETYTVRSGDYLFEPGDDDIYLYVLLSGRVSVNVVCQASLNQGSLIKPLDNINDNNEKKETSNKLRRKEYCMKIIKEGESIVSLLSVLDVICNNAGIFKTVCARAERDSTVCRLKLLSLRESFNKDPASYIRPVQIIITKLMHVTLTTLHHYLGLSPELTRPTLMDSQALAEHRQRHGSTRIAAEVATTRRRRFSGEADVKAANSTAKKKFAQILELSEFSDLSLLEDRIMVDTYAEGTIIIEPGVSDNANLMLVLSGSVKLFQRVGTEQDQSLSDEMVVSVVLADELFGGLRLLTGEPAFYGVKTRSVSRIAWISSMHFYEIMSEKPGVVLPVCKSILARLSPFLRGIDFALDWKMIDSGEALYRQNEVPESLFVVLSGRLRSVASDNENNKKEAMEEYGRGDLVGLVEVLLKRPRSTTVLGVRFSQLAMLPTGLLDYIKLTYPEVAFRMISVLGNYYNNYHRKLTSGFSNEPLSHVRNLHTIAVLPTSRDVPLVPFTLELYHALSPYMQVLRLSSTIVTKHLDATVLEKERDFRLLHWLNAQEDTYPLIIYECDYQMTLWTRRCIHQADALLIVANGTDDPDIQSLEDQIKMQPEGSRTNRELILLWPADTRIPQSTIEWVRSHGWFSGHHHIRCPQRMYQWSPLQLRRHQSAKRRSRQIKKTLNLPNATDKLAAIDEIAHIDESEIVDFYEKHVFSRSIDVHSHFARLARLLTGNAIGIVLSGGGARGAAHVGVLEAMYEHGVPVDIVAGVSIGSLIGGIFCDTSKPDVLRTRAKHWFMHMTSVWAQLVDLTYHYTAIFTGRAFNAGIKGIFGERDIDDLWIPYLTITTDITEHQMRVHRSGPLWPYVRASMSLAGYLPPLCDPQDGHLLLDGGYVNNLPADVLYTLGVRLVLAIDVGSADDTLLTNYGDYLNGFWVLWHRWWPWAKPIRVLNMDEIQNRLAYVSCVRMLEQVKKAPYCRYIRPPVNNYKTLDFGKFDEIYQLGKLHGDSVFAELLQVDEKLGAILNPTKSRLLQRPLLRKPSSGIVSALSKQYNKAGKANSGICKLSPKNNLNNVSFSDLAQAMSRLPMGVHRLPRNGGENGFDLTQDDELPDVYELSDCENSEGAPTFSNNDSMDDDNTFLMEYLAPKSSSNLPSEIKLKTIQQENNVSNIPIEDAASSGVFMRAPMINRQSSNRSQRYSIDDPETVLGHEPTNVSRPGSRLDHSISAQSSLKPTVSKYLMSTQSSTNVEAKLKPSDHF